jgi:MFS family permease
MLAMVTLGVGEIFGALGMGYIVDKIGAKKCCVINTGLMIAQTVAALAFMMINEYSWLAYFMAFLWGVQDSSISIHLDAVLAGEFESNKEPFACDVLIEAVAAFSFEIISSFMTTRVSRMIYIAVVGGIGVFCSFSTLGFKFKPPKMKYLLFDSEDNEKVDVIGLSNPNNYLINDND